MKPADYWKKRSEQIAARQYKKADDFDREQRREYDRATAAIKRDIELFYARFAKNNEIDLAEARKLLTTGELKEFKMTLKEFTATAKNNADGQWTKELNNVYYRTRVSRLEALLVQVNQRVEMLAASRQVGTSALLGGIYKDTYHRTLFELQKGTGVGVSFARIDDEGLQTILGTKLDGRNWSQRIWDDRTKLRQELQTKLSQSFIRGDSVERTVKDLTDRLNVSRSNAERLVQTESAFFTGQATMKGYKESGVVQKYEILATLDNRTSSICRGMDGKVFPLSEMEVGVNYPPFHVRCRTTTTAYFDEEIDGGERIARDADGKSYTVPGNLSYEEWARLHVFPNETNQLSRKNEASESPTPMDPERFKRIKERFEQKGLGVIYANDESEDYLERRGKALGEVLEAVSIGDAILLRKNPSASAVFEEIIHNTQNRNGKVATDEMARIILEIEAAEKLIRHARAYGIPDVETRQTRENLRIYKQRLEELKER